MLQRMDVRTALAALPEKRIHPARRIAAWMARFSILDEPPTSETTSDYRKPASRPATRRIASDSRHALVAKLRFDRVGILRIRILLSTIDSELFVDDTETVRLTVGRSVGKTFEAFDTYFDDGSCLMTWIATPALAAKKFTDDMGHTGTGDFARDLLAHRTAVAVRSATGGTALRLADLDSHIAVGQHYMLHEIPLSLAWRYVLSLVLVSAFALATLVKIVLGLAHSH